MSKVAMSACADYQPQNVQTAVSDVLAQLGGLQNFVKPDQKVFIKVNLVREMSPDKHGTTHPEAVIALVNELSKITQNIIVGDSCGGMYTKGVMNVVYNKCKMTEIANRTCAKLNDDFDFQTVELNGKSLQKCEIINAFTSADVVINFTKLKTHSFAGYTGAVKNLYGLIPGLLKVELHSRFPDLGDFCNLLCDIEQYAKSKIVLHMIDGVIGMEGAGPTNGKPKFIGQILASPNPYELDVVAVSLFGKPFDMPLLQVAKERGLVSDDLDTIDFDFATLEGKFVDNFDIPEVTSANTFLNMPKWVKKLAKKYLTKKVKIDKNRCRGCGKCVTHCPAEALQVVDKKAKLKQSKCIRCYCCQELCPFDAVQLKKTFMYRVLHTFSHTRNKK
ncbi:MAG: DUF362 domain-containing protein [Clostridia bacterium]|nr:DUF362 domain-containing protein [Clostridia bacterium]